MKKIIALFISVILFTTMLSACGNKNNDNPSITAPTNSSDDNLTEQNGDSNEISWETENVEVPDIEDVTVSEITVPNTSVKIKIAKTPFNFNIENFKKAFDESKYISKLYTFATSYGESINGDTYKCKTCGKIFDIPYEEYRLLYYHLYLHRILMYNINYF